MRLSQTFAKPLSFALAALTAACASTPDPRENVSADLETPDYRVSHQDGRFELRAYRPYVVATTTVDGDLDNATRRGFRVLADYIFGGNATETKVAMTAPVAAVPKSTELPLTAERTQDAAGSWEISFMMPSQYGIDALPRPNSDRVRFEERPGTCRAAVVFDGFTTASSIDDQTSALARWVQAQGLDAVGAPVVARYNDPFTLPWNRRNEILVDVDAGLCADNSKRS